MTADAKGRDLFIVDNSVSGWSGLRYLQEWAPISKAFDIATGYFEIGALLALDGRWQELDKIRILMGAETTARTRRTILDAVQSQAVAKLDESVEEAKEPNPFLQGVPAILAAIRSGQIECRAYDKAKFHAKAYITHAKFEVMGAQALVGSSNFTRPGLTNNVELNVQVQSGGQVAQLQDWFETHWDEATEVSEAVIGTIARHTHLYSPFDVYAKALQEFFKGHALTATEWDETRSRMFPQLDRYQKEAYWALMKIARQHGGAFLCDGVGLGKTFVGLMLIERLILHEGKRVALFAPKAAKEAVWQPHLRRWLPHIGGGVDFSNLAVFSHTDVGRKKDFPERFQRISELVSRFPAETKSCSHDRATQMFPVFDVDPRQPEARFLNIDDGFVEGLSAALGVSLNDVDALGEMAAGYIYAVLHSPRYRYRYGDALKTSYPRVPLAAGKSLVRELCRCGQDLLGLHLLESPKLAERITDYAGHKNPKVGRVGWSAGTVWLDARKTLAREGHRATQPGTIAFHGVPEEVWDFHIGGYQVCHKWLKDRKGRTLSDEDIAHYQKIVIALNETIRVMPEIDEVIEAHGGWPGAFQARSQPGSATECVVKVVPFRPRTVQPAPEDRYVTCVPLVPLKTAAGAFSGQQFVEENVEVEWVEVRSRHRLRPSMFVAQVVGRSMEPTIPDGSWCLFRGPVEGSRQGRTVLVQLRDATDPETGQHYTVKRYRSEKAKRGGSWRHERITLEPANPEFEAIVFLDAEEDELQIIAELVEVLTN